MSGRRNSDPSSRCCGATMRIDHVSLAADTFTRCCNHCGKVQITTFEAYRRARARSHLYVVPALDVEEEVRS